MSSIRIALAQTSPVSAQPGPPSLEKPHSTSPFPTLDVNLADATNYVEKAASEGADVVVFPEYFLQGIVNESRQYLTFPSAHLSSALVDLAKKHNISIVGSIVHGSLPSSAHGSPFPDSSPFSLTSSSSKPSAITPGQLAWAKYLEQFPQTSEENAAPVLYNTAFYIEGGTGEIKGEYIKRNLWHPERDYLTAGEKDHQVFETKWGKAGLLICWDMSHPAAAQTLADLGVDIIFAPTYWTGTDSEPIIHNYPHPDTYEVSVVQALSFARAFETETVWVMSNPGGDTREGFMGGSGVWAPLQGRIGGYEGSEVGLKVVDVNLNVLKDGRRLYKIREDWSRREGS